MDLGAGHTSLDFGRQLQYDASEAVACPSKLCGPRDVVLSVSGALTGTSPLAEHRGDMWGANAWRTIVWHPGPVP